MPKTPLIALSLLLVACGGTVGYEVPETSPETNPATVAKDDGTWTVDATLTSGAPDCARFLRLEAADLARPIVSPERGCELVSEVGERAVRYVCGADCWAWETEDDGVRSGTYWDGVYGPPEKRCTYRLFAWR
jgi:hypothetical protein